MKYILCQRRRVYAGKKSLRWHRHINAFFGLKTVVNQKSVNLGMISARHTSNRQSSKKVTCPFKDRCFLLQLLKLDLKRPAYAKHCAAGVTDLLRYLVRMWDCVREEVA